MNNSWALLSRLNEIINLKKKTLTNGPDAVNAQQVTVIMVMQRANKVHVNHSTVT